MIFAHPTMRWSAGCVFALLATAATAIAGTPVVDYEVRRATPDAYEFTVRFPGGNKALRSARGQRAIVAPIAAVPRVS